MTSGRRSSLRRRLVYTFALLATASMSLVVFTGYQAALLLRKTRWLANANHLATEVVESNAIQARERGFTATALARPEGATGEVRQTVAQLRAQGDAAYQRALRLAESMSSQIPSHPLAASVAELKRQRAALMEARQAADATLSGQPPSIAPEAWFSTATAAIESLAKVRLTAFTPIDPLDRLYHDNLLVRELAFQASEHAGRERAMMSVAINRGAKLEGERLRQLEHDRAVVDENLERLRELPSGRPDMPRALTLAIERLDQEYFGRFEKLRQEVYQAGMAGRPYPVDSRLWWEEATRGIESILAVGDVLTSHSVHSVSEQEQLLRWMYLALVLLSGAVLGVAVTGVVIIRRRVVLPLRQLQQASRTIEQGNLQIPVPPMRADELGELGHTFESMREALNARAERQEALLKELAEAVRRREEFVHLVSHDLRGPLTVILTQTHVLRRMYPEADQRLLHAISVIERGGKRLSGMITDLVESARIDSGQVELHKAKVSLPLLVTGLLEQLAAPERERIRLEVAGEVPEVSADAARLERILANLITNALKYSPAEAEVRVRVEQKGSELVTSVSDRGEGIAPEDQPRLFSRFYRSSGAKEKAEGLGLGLYIARMLVEAHGGRIWVESKPGEGSTFSFSLPME